MLREGSEWADLQSDGVRKPSELPGCARASGFDRKNFIRKLVRGIPVKHNSYTEFERWLQSYESQVGVKSVPGQGASNYLFPRNSWAGSTLLAA
jgi:hypothetical protein